MEHFGNPQIQRHLISNEICRQFINGSCRYGSRCHYQHEWPVIASPQTCRYFQKGICWYGEHCRYLHILPGDGRIGRRISAPAVHISQVYNALPDCRASEPASFQGPGFSSQYHRGLESLLTDVAHVENNFRPLTTNITDDDGSGGPSIQPQESYLSHHHNLVHVVPTNPLSERSETLEEGKQVVKHIGATASEEQPETDAFIQSKEVTCGICMDKVYEKTTAEERRFGILPNCNHSFCLGCIVTWRKTKNFQEEVIKGCPQCRVKSAFYVPNKYWVEGHAKRSLIAIFREKCSKRRCSFFMRYGCCPFKSDCLFWHHLPHGYRPPCRRLPTHSHSHYAISLDDLDNLQLLDYVIAMTLLDNLLDADDEDDLL